MYADDFVVFPHMPMNSAGYDCRASHIMADWMVSIPAVRKSPQVSEDTLYGNKPYDNNAQPYVEVLPTDPAYADAQAAARARLDEYHNGGRYDFCPDTSDIVDPSVVAAGGGDPPSLRAPQSSIPRTGQS